MSDYVDGNFATAVLTKNIVSYPFPFPSNSNTKQFDLEFVQTEAYYTEPALGSTSALAPSAYLCDKGPREKIGATLIRYRQTFVQLPTNWTETQQVAYTFPGLSGPASPNVNTFNPYYYRAPATLYKIATVYHNYTASATSPTLSDCFQVTDGGNVVDYIGPQNPNIGAGLTSPNTEPTTYTVSSDAVQIRPLIWEKITLTVPKPV